MSRTVGINSPKTACTTEARGMAKCTIPNICKMPGPPAPFIPTPLPNIGKSNLSPQGYTTTVKLEGQTVAIRGATFESIGDMASKGTGGGLISANCHGPTKFITPGSMNVKMEGKAVHLLGEPMLNNCGPGGSPPNTGATMMGFDTFDASGGGDPPGSECARVAAKIDDLINRKIPEGEIPHKTKGLKHRFAEQLAGSMPPGTPGWANHEKTILEQQRGLKKQIRYHQSIKPPCKTPLAADARDWADKPPPTEEDYKKHGPPVGTQFQFGGKFS